MKVLSGREFARVVERHGDMRDGGILSGAAYEKITKRHTEAASAAARPLSGDDIRALRR